MATCGSDHMSEAWRDGDSLWFEFAVIVVVVVVVVVIAVRLSTLSDAVFE
ncbi:MAG: hypothetical protein JRK53_10930 [Deltaproteobacteria bacterium]|nr:hypothetical protein [Deltaproteobacteria bacterium]